MSNQTTWTKPYFGVQHLNGLRNGYQATVNELSNGACTAVIFVMGTPNYFSGRFNSAHSDVTAARAWCEQQSRDISAFA